MVSREPDSVLRRPCFGCADPVGCHGLGGIVKRIDTFPYSGEADMLECRLTELDPVIDLFVIVEADVTHGGNRPKPYHYLEHQERFAPWADKIRYVQATDLPTIEDAWSRELAQREWISTALTDVAPDDVIFHGDVDEIPTTLAIRSCRPGMGRNPKFIAIPQRFHPFAVDWLHPGGWRGTVATRVRDVESFSSMRNERLLYPHRPAHADALPIAHGGWHFSWVSDGLDAKRAKIDSFCHPEISDNWQPHLADCYAAGLHVDGTHLEPVDVDDSWPRWIVEGNAPEMWFRPKGPRQAPPAVWAVPAYGPLDKGYEYKAGDEPEAGWEVIGRAGDGLLMSRKLNG